MGFCYAQNVGRFVQNFHPFAGVSTRYSKTGESFDFLLELKMNEDEVKQSIRAFYGLRLDIKLFPNPVGNAYVSSSVLSDQGGVYLKHPRRVEYGLCKGSADLIGWVVINGIARFLALEVKTATGKPTDEQLNFIAQVKAAGGVAGVVRSVMDVELLLLEAGYYEGRVA
jgi:hypothetical protein